jgi:hypothetical protein
MPLKIDGPAGRQEITREYRNNYDRIFRGVSATFCGDTQVSDKCLSCTTPQCHFNKLTPEKSNETKCRYCGRSLNEYDHLTCGLN